MPFIRFFADLSQEDVPIAGGKGASLGELTRTGIPVPPGYVILTNAFDHFIRDAGLEAAIETQLHQIHDDDITSIEHASAVICGLIHNALIPKEIQRETWNAYRELGSEFVAVRSSATAEDSSQASWAGELESYLNTTETVLFENIKKCWASLFTPRAIVYRNEKGMRDVRVSVAVVIQKMVQSEVAGITFTVHPVTKNHHQMIIEACYGLGEFIVGGRVTPDTYVIDKRDGTLIDVTISEQGELLERGPNGNIVANVPEHKRNVQKIDNGQIRELSDICKRIEKQYHSPCDIEWGMEKNTFFILQSRPITTL